MAVLFLMVVILNDLFGYLVATATATAIAVVLYCSTSFSISRDVVITSDIEIKAIMFNSLTHQIQYPDSARNNE